MPPRRGPDAPVDRRPEQALPLGQVACAARKEVEHVAEALGGALGAEHPHARRRQLEGERQAVERPADSRDRGAFCSVIANPGTLLRARST